LRPAVHGRCRPEVASRPGDGRPARRLRRALILYRTIRQRRRITRVVGLRREYPWIDEGWVSIGEAVLQALPQAFDLPLFPALQGRKVLEDLDHTALAEASSAAALALFALAVGETNLDKRLVRGIT